MGTTSIDPNKLESVVRDARKDFEYYYGSTFRDMAIATQNEVNSNNVELMFLIAVVVVVLGLAVVFLLRLRQEKYANKKVAYDVGVAVQASGGSGIDALQLEDEG